MLGELIMKTFNIITLNSFIVVITTLSSFAILAEQSQQQKPEAALGKSMQIKCHVEYQGGGDDIRFVIGSYNNANQAMRTLQGRKTLKGNGKIQKTIYKVKECVQQHERFAGAKARQLDKVTAR